jgi:ligand-binding SRPBCC domain-containing protein
MACGLRIDYTIRWLGIPLGWATLITGYDPPHSFEDTQTRGPYARWVHQHHFRTADGGTWIEDEVSYRLPLGPLGHLAHALLVGRQLRAIFEYRGIAIEKWMVPEPEREPHR